MRVAKEVGEVVKGALDIHHKILGNEPMPLRCAKCILGHGLQTSHSRIGGFRGTSRARSDMAAGRAVEVASAVCHKSQGSECSAPKRRSHIWCSLGRLPQTSGSHTPDQYEPWKFAGSVSLKPVPPTGCFSSYVYIHPVAKFVRWIPLLCAISTKLSVPRTFVSTT